MKTIFGIFSSPVAILFCYKIKHRQLEVEETSRLGTSLLIVKSDNKDNYFFALDVTKPWSRR